MSRSLGSSQRIEGKSAAWFRPEQKGFELSGFSRELKKTPMTPAQEIRKGVNESEEWNHETVSRIFRFSIEGESSRHEPREVEHYHCGENPCKP